MSFEARQAAHNQQNLSDLAATIAQSFASLGVADQGASTTDSPTYVAMTTTGAITAGTTVTAGTNIVATAGSILSGTTITAGSALVATTTVTAGTGVVATTGGVTASAGNIVATLGNITASAGDIAATLGSVAAGTTVTAGTGIVATTGDISATTGDVKVSTGNGFFVNNIKVVTDQQALISPMTITPGAGALPVANGALAVADTATPTVVELLEGIVELKAKQDAILVALKAHGLVASA